MDWRRYGEIGMGILGWSPDAFWRATPGDLAMALDGWREKHGIGRAGGALTAADVAQLRARLSGIADEQRRSNG